MRILFFINHLADGGAERVAALLLNHLCEQHNIELILFCDKKSSYYISPTILFQEILINNKLKVIRFVRRILEIRNLIKQKSPDIIISFLTHTNSYVLIANLFLKRKTIVMEQTSIQRPASAWHSFSRRILYRLATKVILVSNDDCRHAQWLHNKLCIHNPVSFNIYKGGANREPLVVAIGAQSRWYVKGFDLLILAWAKIAQSHSKWKLQFIGSKDDNYISDMVKTYRLENQVDYIGWKDNIDEVLQTKSIYVLSSRNEGFPNSLIEAMSKGCACVAFDCKTGPNEIIVDGESGLLARNGDVDDLADKLQQLIEDENLRHKLSNEATEKAKKFDKDTFFAKWDSLIDEVTAK